MGFLIADKVIQYLSIFSFKNMIISKTYISRPAIGTDSSDVYGWKRVKDSSFNLNFLTHLLYIMIDPQKKNLSENLEGNCLSDKRLDFSGCLFQKKRGTIAIIVFLEFFVIKFFLSPLNFLLSFLSLLVIYIAILNDFLTFFFVIMTNYKDFLILNQFLFLFTYWEIYKFTI